MPHTTDDVPLLVGKLARLPSASTHKFGQDVRHILNGLTYQVASMRCVLEDATLPHNVRFAALYALSIRFWREKEYRKYIDLIQLYDGEFGEEPLYDVFRAQAELSLGDDTSHLKSALEYADAARINLPRLPGVLHLYAELIASIEERKLEPDRGELQRAESAVRRAVSSSEGKYAKYYATLARLQLLGTKFDDARSSLQSAIDKEDTSASDYPLRLTEYQLIRQRVEFAEQQSQVRKTERRAMDELREFRGQMLQSMGLLAAVIAFVVATISDTSNSPFAERAGAILVQSGCILIVFAAFGGIYRVARPWGVAVAAIISAGVIGAGLFIGGYTS